MKISSSVFTSKTDELELQNALALLESALHILDSQPTTISIDFLSKIQLLLENAESYAFILRRPTLNNEPIYGKYTFTAAKKFLALNTHLQPPSPRNSA